MKSSSYLVFVIYSLLLSPLAFGNGKTTEEFTGFIHFCGGGPPDKVIVTPGGKTVHIRGATNFNEWVTGNDLIDGAETNVVSANFNQNGGNVHLDVTLVPDAFDGTWEITQTIKIAKDGSVSGHGVGHGTGELHGLIIKFTAGEEVVVANPCSGLPSGVVEGVIILPAAN